MNVISLPARASAPIAVSRREVAGNADVSRLTRYRMGTYSHTVGTLTFTDGSVARTDLIRLNPNVEAYSLDFGGIAPTRPSHYRAAGWTAVANIGARAHEPEVDWILRNSFPTIRPAELSNRLRAAGYPLGPANIAEHEAIAATQAAIWYFTNGMELDRRPRNVPAAVRRRPDSVVFEFDGAHPLGGYTVDVRSGRAVGLRLQKSVDGSNWRDVTSSTLTTAGPGTYRKALGAGSTLSRHTAGKAAQGYRYYRLLTNGARLGEVTFWLDGVSHFRNLDRVVHLYDHLLAGARWARRHAVAPELSVVDAVVDGGLIGPLRLHANQVAALQVSHGTLLDADGAAVTDCEPGAQFYVRPAPGRQAVTVTATVPARADGFGGRVITGVAIDHANSRDANSRLTPVALAVPAPLVVDFHLQWAAGAETQLPQLRAVGS
ncbi:MAG: thioester domain-containing protein [Mycobacterium sp.]